MKCRSLRRSPSASPMRSPLNQSNTSKKRSRHDGPPPATPPTPPAMPPPGAPDRDGRSRCRGRLDSAAARPRVAARPAGDGRRPSRRAQPAPDRSTARAATACLKNSRTTARTWLIRAGPEVGPGPHPGRSCRCRAQLSTNRPRSRAPSSRLRPSSGTSSGTSPARRHKPSRSTPPGLSAKAKVEQEAIGGDDLHVVVVDHRPVRPAVGERNPERSTDRLWLSEPSYRRDTRTRRRRYDEQPYPT